MGELKKEVLLDTIRQFGGQPKTVTVHRAFVEFTGSLEAGMMLSQLLYWSERDGGRGRVAKSDAEWIEELCLTQYAVRQARKTLEKMEILRAEVHRFNGVPTVHYFLLEDALSAKWELWIQNSDIAKTQERSCESAKSLTESTTESTTAGESKTDSPATAKQTLPVKIPVVLENTEEMKPGTSSDALFDAMHSESEGLPLLGELTAGVADPQIAEKEYVKRLAPMLASVFGRKVITEDRQAARRAFGLHLNPEFVERRVIAYRNGEGEDFRKADATAFWVVSRLEKDMAMGIGARRVIKVSA